MSKLRYVCQYTVAAVLIMAACALVIPLMAGMRSWSYGLSLSSLICVVVFGPVYFAIVSLLLLVVLGVTQEHPTKEPKLIRRLIRRTMLLAAAFVFVAFASVEIWFGVEDYAFYREVQAESLEFHSRPRWRPFSSAGLMYEEGRYLAHD